MTDQLWASAKHMAQVDGRRYDWVYITSLYKSMGGTQMALTIFVEGQRHEVIGETENGDIVICDKNGEVKEIEKSFYEKSRKKFMKRDISKAKPTQKVEVEIKGKREKLTIQKGVEWK